MKAPADLTNLHEITGNDARMEALLFAEFYDAFEKGIDVLKKNSMRVEHEEWRSQAHALKGLALNLGAEKLAGFCKKAQDDCTAQAEVKHEMLGDIISEYQQVKEFLSHPSP